jgi:hypothetical protein
LSFFAGLRQPLRRANGYNCRPPLTLLPIQRDQSIAQLFCQSDINRIVATDPVLGSYQGSPLSHRQRDWNQLDHF